MKTTTNKQRMVVWATALAASLAFGAAADSPTPAGKAEKTWTGTVTSVDPNEHMVESKGLFLSKKFNLGSACTYAMLESKTGSANDLRPGEKVTITYQDAGGVLVADRIEQLPMQYEGMVKAVDPANHTMTVHDHGDRTFQIANGCAVALREDKPGTLADIQVGNHVTVTYETPGNKPTVREIAQTSATFAGTLTAVDLDERTVKAKTLFDTKKFNLADNCAIVINGKTDGRLSDLKPEDKLVFSYDEIDGINVVNRIAPAGTPANNANTMGLTGAGSQ